MKRLILTTLLLSACNIYANPVNTFDATGSISHVYNVKADDNSAVAFVASTNNNQNYLLMVEDKISIKKINARCRDYSYCHIKGTYVLTDRQVHPYAKVLLIKSVSTVEQRANP